MVPELSDLLPDYASALAGEGRSRLTVRTYLYAVRFFIAWSGCTQVDQLSEWAIERYRDERIAAGVSKATAFHNLCAIHSFCKWLQHKGYLDSDPVALVRYPRIPKRLPRALRPAELDRLLQAVAVPCDATGHNQFLYQRNRALILLLLYTGLRLSESAALVWSDIDLDDRVLVVRSGKGDKSRVVPISRQLMPELLYLPVERWGADCGVFQKYNGGRLRPKGVSVVFSEWLPRKGVHGVTAHRLRHTFASSLLRSGVDLPRIQRLMGHENIMTTARYLLLADDGDRKAVDALCF